MSALLFNNIKQNKMADCNSLTGIPKGCENNTGGIYTAYGFDMEDIDTITEDPATWTISALTLVGHSPALVFNFKRNTSNYTDEAAIDLVAGSSFFTKTINLIFNRRDADKSKSVKILGEGQRYLSWVIGDANGKFWYFDYMQLSAVGGGSGTARADGSNYNVTLVGQGEFLAKEVSAAIAAALLVPNS